MNTYVIAMTPMLAEEWLKSNTHNRPVKEAHVRHLAREMEEGRWKLNGESIKRNGEVLIDGQHRLLACVKTGIPFNTVVVDGLSEDVFDTIDGCVTRSASDTLAILGEKNTKRLAAALALVDRYFTGRMGLCVRYSNTECEEILLRHPNIRISADRCDFRTPLAPPSIVAFAHYIFAQKNTELANRFIDDVLRGRNLSEHAPAYLLRERLLKNLQSKAKLRPEYIAALFIKAWNATRLGTSMRQLRFRERGDKAESFPMAV